jgi:hypothetical protein
MASPAGGPRRADGACWPPRWGEWRCLGSPTALARATLGERHRPHHPGRGTAHASSPRCAPNSPARTTSADHRPTAGIARALAYLDAKQPCLAYHIALTLGFPIATGVIKGCCRFIVKDRLDVTGARWSLAGAEAILKLRAVIANGDIDAHWAFHIQREYERTHAARYQDQLKLAA